MRSKFILLSLLVLFAAGHAAMAGPYTPAFLEFTGFSRGGENGKHVVRSQGFIFWTSREQDGNSHVFDGNEEYIDNDRRAKLTITGTINLADNDGYTDVTTVTAVTFKFVSDEKYYFSNAAVTTMDGTAVTGVNVAGGGDYRDWIQITIPAGKAFGRIDLTIDTHLPLGIGATIDGIDEVYVNDHVNRPEPIVIHHDPGSSPVQLTKGVDYTVRYAKNDKAGTATVTVTGTGDYLGELSKNFTIRDLSLADDFTWMSSSNAYAISNQKDLDNLAKLVNDGTDCAGISFLQTQDISYTDHGKGLPIGMDGKPFRGSYNGQNYVISGLVVDNNGTFEPDGTSQPYYKYRLYSGLFGKLDGASVRNVRLVSPVIKNTPNVGSYMQGIVGGYILDFLRVVGDVKLWYHSAGIAAHIQNGSRVSDCYVYQPSFTFVTLDYSSSLDVFQQVSAPVIYASVESTESANAQVYKATAGSKVSFASSGTIASGDGFIYSGSRYYRADAAVPVTYTGTAPGDGQQVVFTDGDGNLLNAGGSGNAYTVLMPDRDVTISASVVSLSQISLTASAATLQGMTGYWVTFYHGDYRYTLPDGAAAYTMDTNHHLYRLGTDGRTIPANTAVIILSDKSDITLSLDSGTSNVAINGGGNILRGSDSPVAVSGTPYVLGLVGTKLGFYEYTGGVIPAHKAYYVQ